MFDTIYIEDQIADHPRTRDICARFPQATRVHCERYGEVFNPKAQNFRLQKRKPALILAHKYHRRVLETPDGPEELEHEMSDFCTRELLKHVPEALLFPCKLAA